MPGHGRFSFHTLRRVFEIRTEHGCVADQPQQLCEVEGVGKTECGMALKIAVFDFFLRFHNGARGGPKALSTTCRRYKGFGLTIALSACQIAAAGLRHSHAPGTVQSGWSRRSETETERSGPEWTVVPQTLSATLASIRN